MAKLVKPKQVVKTGNTKNYKELPGKNTTKVKAPGNTKSLSDGGKKTSSTKSTANTTNTKSTSTTKSKASSTANYTNGTETSGDQIGQSSLINNDFGYKASQVDKLNLADAIDRQGMVNRQNNSLNNLQDASEGRGPSIAQLQYEKNRDENMAANSAMAASATGGNRALAARSAMYANAAANQTSVRDVAALRATEMMQARKEFADAISSANVNDLAYGNTQLGYTQKSNEANAKALNDAGQYNQTNAYNVAKANQDALNARRTKQAELAAGITQARASASGQVGAANAMAGASRYGSELQAGTELAKLAGNTRDQDLDRSLANRQRIDTRNQGYINAGSNAAARTATM